MPPINYDDLSDFEDLPSVNDILSSKPAAQEKLTDFNPEVIALDTEMDDPGTPIDNAFHTFMHLQIKHRCQLAMEIK